MIIVPTGGRSDAQVMRTAVRKKPPFQKTDVGSAVTQDPVWVIRVELTVRRSLPVFLDKRTIFELVACLKGARNESGATRAYGSAHLG
jgi:hypothetical protein